MSYQTKINDDLLEMKAQFSRITELPEINCIVYFHLLNSGPKSAGEISKELEIERSKVYRLVQDMAESGWLLSTFNSPMRYYPLDPLKLINRIMEKKEKEVEDLERKKDLILSRLETNTEKNFSYTYKTVGGKGKIYPAIYKLFKENREVIYMVANPKDLEKLFTPFFEKSLKQFKEKGGLFRLMTDKEVEKFYTFSKKHYHREITRLSEGKIIVGENTVLLTVVPEKYPNEEICIYTNSPEFVKNMQNLCNFWWEMEE